MAQPAKSFSLRKRADSPAQQERRELLEGLARTRVLINQAYACFNRESDPDLIESYVFEINALQSRYSYLLRRVRELEQEREQPPVLPAAEA
ncbi:MAG: DUF2508 family protein [Oscillospiraceae bacterium]